MTISTWEQRALKRGIEYLDNNKSAYADSPTRRIVAYLAAMILQDEQKNEGQLNANFRFKADTPEETKLFLVLTDMMESKTFMRIVSDEMLLAGMGRHALAEHVYEQQFTVASMCGYIDEAGSARFRELMEKAVEMEIDHQRTLEPVALKTRYIDREPPHARR